MSKRSTVVQIIASAILLVASLLMVNSCKDEEVSPGTTSKEIDKTGGLLTGTDGVVNLNLPEGALGANTTISIEASSDAGPANGIGKVYKLSPDGTQFAKPVKLSFKYSDDDALAKSPSAMAIAFKKPDNTWQIMPTLDLDVVTHTVTTETTHFSEWTLLEIPTISSFAPTSGIVGTQVTITGINFSATPADNKVLMNGKQATVISSSTTQIVFTVPVGAATGSIVVQTKFGNLDYTLLSTNFTVDSSEPEIISFSPASGVVGATVTISGINFSAIPSENSVKFSGFPATVTSSSTTQLVVIVPGATTGKFVVTTTYNDLFWTAMPATDFVVETNEPTITGFTPTSGVVGTTLTINGKNFSAIPSENSVKFSGFPATVTSSSTTQLVVIVPGGATTGKFLVTTTYNDLFWTAMPVTDFVVETNEPAITGFSPTTGPVGTTVTITGKNFSATPSDNKVTMDGHPATVTSSSTTQIVFTVPAGVTAGSIFVQTMYNQLNWTVVAASNFVVN
ncbi:MAG: IPT/TIG domain-containing protein [Flammeovirgaceae bacterium]|nr:IPT/TIG domain-containing protein [Flammeovirgaceae bacterium]